MTVCSRCVLDSSDLNISFDEVGVCNYCRMDATVRQTLPLDKWLFDRLAAEMKEWGNDKQYDCMLGFSGGVDSSYVAYLAKEAGLNVLLVHCDNGFDAPVAMQNVKRVVKGTGFHLLSCELPFDEFADLLRCFLFASVLDADIPADHAIVASNMGVAKRYGFKFLLDGYNHATEFYVPRAWTYANKNDLVNLKNIHRRFGRVKLKRFPLLGFWGLLWNRHFHDFRRVFPLQYINYRKTEALRVLEREFGYEPYGHKHHENVFSRFYQDYILFKKFGVDKRKSHFSSLIRNNEISRDEALKELKKNPYEPTSIYGCYVDNYSFEEDKRFVLGKLGLSDEEFEQVMRLPPVSHDFYGTDKNYYKVAGFVSRQVKRLKRQPAKLLKRFC